MEFGVIGWGLRKSIALEAHRPEKGHRLAALADPDPIAQERFRDTAGAEAFVTSDFRELLDRNLDAIFVLSPDHLHEEQAVAILEAGVPVYLEKPMAITVEGCDRILETAQRTGVNLYLGHNMRHFPVVRLMKQWIDAGKIGRVQTAWCRQFVSYGGDAYYKDWHADRRNTTGLLLQKGAHDLDVLHWLCAGYASRVTAMGKLMVYGDLTDRQRPGDRVEVSFDKTWPPRSLSKLHPTVDVEDVNMMLMELDNGVLASYEHCMFAPDSWRNYTIFGDEGRIENFGDGPGAVVKLWNRARYGFDPEGDESETIPASDGTHGGADFLIIDEFLRYLETGGPVDASPIAARMAVAAGVAGTESLRNGSIPMTVAPLPASLRG